MKKLVKRVVLICCGCLLYPSGMSRSYAADRYSEAGSGFADEDPDRDGLSNSEEAERGTEPDNPDTDGDGKGDAQDAVGYDPFFTFDAAPESRYAVIDLGIFPTGLNVRSVNNLGQVVFEFWRYPDPASFEIREPKSAPVRKAGVFYDMNNLGDYLYVPNDLPTSASGHDSPSDPVMTLVLQGTESIVRKSFFGLIESTFAPTKQYPGDPGEEEGFGLEHTLGSIYSAKLLDSGGIVSTYLMLDIGFEYSRRMDVSVWDLPVQDVWGWPGDYGYIRLTQTTRRYTTMGFGVWTLTITDTDPPPLGAGNETRFGDFVDGFVFDHSSDWGAHIPGWASNDGERWTFSDGSTVPSPGGTTTCKAVGRLPGQTGLWKSWINSSNESTILSLGGPETGNTILSRRGGTNIAVSKIATNGLLFTSGGLWRNGRIVPPDQLIGTSGQWSGLQITRMSDNGLFLAGSAKKTADNTLHAVLLVPVEVTFEPVGDNDNISDNKNPMTGQFMPGKGKRIFPDDKAPEDQTPRNHVYVKVKTGMPNIKVHLKAFDVDDPSSDPLIDRNDGGGSTNSGQDNLQLEQAAGMPHTPIPPLWTNDSETIECMTDSEGIAKVGGNLPELKVTYNPGDNVRIAVALMDEGATELTKVQVMNKGAAGYIAGDSKQQPSGFNGVVSPMLTTWRKLHIEVDTMEKWAGDKPSPDRVMVTGVSWDKNNPSGNSVLTLSGVPSVPDNFYARGFIKAGGVQFNITSSTGNTVKIFHGSNLPTDEQYNAFIGSVELHDDDDRSAGTTMLDGSDLLAFYAHGNVINDTLKKKYAPAYIEIEEAPHTAGYNTRPTIPFQINAGQLNLFTSLNDHQDMRGKDRETYWYHFVVMAYQYTPGPTPIINTVGGDNDPNGESGLDGGTIGDSVQPYISVIFLERLRDSFDGSRDDGDLLEKVNNRIDQVTAHEIGHAPGNGNDEDHAEGGLMGDGADGAEFMPATLYRFRSTSQWQQ